MSEEQTVPEMRKTIERLQKEKAGLRTEVSDLTTTVRVSEAKDAFRSAGYNPNNGALYAAMNPDGDISADAVVAFASEQGLAAVEATQAEDADAGEGTTEVTDGTEALAPLAGSGSRAGDGGAGGAEVKPLTRQEWQQLYASDPSAAKAAIASGRVQVSTDNVYVAGTSPVKGVNPYVAVSDDS